jgi:hypothetical protein
MAREGVVRIVLNAVDQFSSVLTGINSGLEIVGKAFSGMQAIATVSLDAISTGLALVAEGGEAREIQNQFENLADAYKVNGKEILGVIDTITEGTLRQADQIKIATGAVVAGLSSEDLRAALNLAKGRVEAIGGSVVETSKVIFDALNTGKYAPLSQFDVFAEKGEDVASVLEKVRLASQAFGDSGFNAADNFAAMTAKLEDFRVSIGSAMNDAPTFQSALTAITEIVLEFTRSFDTKQLSRFFEFLLQAGTVTLDAFLGLFGQSIDGVTAMLRGLATQEGAGAFFNGLIEYARSAGVFFVRWGSLFAGVLTSLGSYLGSSIKFFADWADSIKFYGATAVEFIARTFSSFITQYSTALNEFAALSPSISENLGITDSALNSLRSFEKTLYDTVTAAQAWKQEAITGTGDLGALSRFGQNIEDSFDLDGKLQSIESFAANATSAINSIEIGEIQVKRSVNTEAAQRAIEELKAQRARSEEDADDKANERKAKSAEAAAKRSVDIARKEQEDKKRLLEQALRDIEEIEKKRDSFLRKGVSGFYTFTAEESAALAKKDAIKKALDEITRAEKSATLARADELLRGVTDYKKFGQDIANAVKPFKDALQGDQTLTLKTAEQEKTVNVRVEGPVSWPAALKELVTLIIQSIVQQMQGERLPLAISTTAR